MAPVMKLTMRYEEGDAKHHTTLKVKLPRGWKEGPVSNLKHTFIESYNSKHPDNKLSVDSIHFVTPKGEQLADEDIVIKVLAPSDTIRVKPGAPPSLEAVKAARKAGAKKVIRPITPKDEDSGRVTSAEALKAAAEPKFAFDYSKWDKLDLSDEDGDDCHPNIDLESWKRLRGRQRKERREKEDTKISKFNAKIEKYKKKVAQLQKKIDKGDDNPQLQVDLQDAKNSQLEYEVKLEKFKQSRKLVADDVCDVKESRGLVAPDVSEKPQKNAAMYPQAETQEYSGYEDFQEKNRKFLKTFSQMSSDVDSQEYLLAHPDLLSEHSEGFLMILTLDTCIKHQLTDMDPTIEKSEEQIKAERLREYIVGRQHLTVHYICELAKSLRQDPRAAVKPFFRKTGPRAEDKVEGFEEDLAKFLTRIRNRAAEKIKNGELTPLVDPESSLVEQPEVLYEPVGLGPGGLDPNEVLQSLPQTIQEAFMEQDTDKLREGFEALPEEEAEYHFKRCIDSGLWVPQGGMEEGEGDAEGPSSPTESEMVRDEKAQPTN